MNYFKKRVFDYGKLSVAHLKYPTVAIGVLFCLVTHAQNPSLDSLRTIINRAPDSEKKLNDLHRLFNYTLDRNIAKATDDARSGLKIASQLNSKAGEVRFLADLGLAYFTNGKVTEARQVYQQALNKSSELKSPDDRIAIFIYLSTFYRSIGKLDSARYFISLATPLFEEASINSKLDYHQSKGWLAFQLSNFKDAIHEARQKIKLNPGKETSVYPLLSRSYLRLELYDSAKAALEQAFNSFNNDKDSLTSRYYIALLINRGDLFMETSNYPAALVNYEKAYSQASSFGFKLYQASAGFKMGFFFEITGNFPKAVELYEESINLYSEYNAAQEIARINARIAWALIYSQNLVLAEQFAKRSLGEMKQVSDIVGTAFAWNIIGYLNAQQGEYGKALQYYDSALRVRKIQQSPVEYFRTIYNIAEVHEQQGKLMEALKMMEAVLEQEQKNSLNLNNLIFTHNSIGRLYFKVGNNQLAETNYLKAYEFSKKNKLYPQLKTSLINLLDLYEKNNNGFSVIKYYRELVSVNDTLFVMDQSNKILQVSALRELEAHKQEVEQLRSLARIEAINAAQKSQALTLYAYLIALLLITLVLVGYIAYSRKKSQNQLAEINKQLEAKVLERTSQLKSAYEELETYFYKASHDLRGPITTLLGLVQLLKTNTDSHEMEKIHLHIEQTVDRQLNMVNKIQSLNSVLKTDVTEELVELNREIDEILRKQEVQINEKKIQVIVNLKVDKVMSSPSLLTTILENLIDNSITYSNNVNPQIILESKTKDGITELSITDNGEGIHQNIKENLYKMFFRGSMTSSGSGLGLYIAKKSAEKLGASIAFESIPFERTVFTIQLKNTDHPLEPGGIISA